MQHSLCVARPCGPTLPLRKCSAVVAPPCRPALALRHPVSSASNRSSIVARATDPSGFLDLAKLVSSAGGQGKTPYENLASQIGRDIYVDVGGWHLFLRDLSAAPGLKMAQALALQLGPQLSRKGISESEVAAVLKKVPVKLGGGKTTLTLFEVMPSFCVADLTKLLDEYGRNN